MDELYYAGHIYGDFGVGAVHSRHGQLGNKTESGTEASLEYPGKAVMISTVALLILASNSYALPEAPFTAMCTAAEETTLPQIFKTPACNAQFDAVYAANDVAATHAWMVDNRLCFKEWAHFSWLAYAANQRKMADLAHHHQLYLLRERGMAGESCDTHSCLVEDVDQTLARAETTAISAEAMAHTDAFLDIVEQNTAFAEKMESAFAAVRPLCLLHFNLECIGAMNQALTWMYPRSYRLSADPPENLTYSMLTFTREVFKDDRTQKYAAHLARDLLRAIESEEYLAPDFLDFYSLAVQAFDEDYDRLWKFLAVYATRGAAWATGYQMVHADNQPIFAAFMVISSAMGYLDIAWFNSGRAWSYPAGTTTTCFQPKPYHFWMAGSFAYLLRQEGFSARTSKQVARLLGAMYEAGSTTMGRDPDLIYFVPMFDAIPNRARREVSHHALGALTGIDYQNPEAADFDSTLTRLIKESRAVPDMSEEELRRALESQPRRWQLWSDLVGFYETFND
jgi:hypothetical protein